MKKKISAKINGTQLFLLLVFAIYLILLLVNPSLFRESLMQFLRILREIITPFIVVFVLMFCFNLFLNKERMARLLGESSGLKGWIIAIIGGILSMGPIYIWYPLISELQKRGVRDSFIATFLYNRAIQLPLLPIMAYHFGLDYTIILTLYMILFSVINGILINKFLSYENNKGSQ